MRCPSGLQPLRSYHSVGHTISEAAELQCSLPIRRKLLLQVALGGLTVRARRGLITEVQKQPELETWVGHGQSDTRFGGELNGARHFLPIALEIVHVNDTPDLVKGAILGNLICISHDLVRRTLFFCVDPHGHILRCPSQAMEIGWLSLLSTADDENITPPLADLARTSPCRRVPGFHDRPALSDCWTVDDNRSKASTRSRPKTTGTAP